jgi:hypothetical protein
MQRLRPATRNELPRNSRDDARPRRTRKTRTVAFFGQEEVFQSFLQDSRVICRVLLEACSAHNNNMLYWVHSTKPKPGVGRPRRREPRHKHGHDEDGHLIKHTTVASKGCNENTTIKNKETLTCGERQGEGQREPLTTARTATTGTAVGPGGDIVRQYERIQHNNKKSEKEGPGRTKHSNHK